MSDCKFLFGYVKVCTTAYWKNDRTCLYNEMQGAERDGGDP